MARIFVIASRINCKFPIYIANFRLTEQIGVKEHLEKKVEDLSKKIDGLERRPAAVERENAGQAQAEQVAQEVSDEEDCDEPVRMCFSDFNLLYAS